MAGLGSSAGNRCTAPVTVLGRLYSRCAVPTNDVEPATAVVRTWPTAAAGGFFAPSGANSKPQQTRQAVRPRVFSHLHMGRNLQLSCCTISLDRHWRNSG